MNKKNALIIVTLLQSLFLIYKSSSSSEKRLISIPFFIPSPNPQLITNSKTFFQYFFTNRLIFNISLGSKETQNINGIISQHETCFEFIDVETDNNLKNLKKYSPKDSSSFNLRTERNYISYQPDEYMALGSDIFLFDENKENNDDKYNISFMFMKTTNESNIKYDLIKSKKYIAKIGLDLYDRDIHYNVKCPQFTYDIKKNANLSKYILSFEFTDKDKGNMVYGNELYIHNKKNIMNHNILVAILQQIIKFFLIEYIYLMKKII